MPYGGERSLTPSERRALSPGLEAALGEARLEPVIIARAALGARIASVWRGHLPILTWGSRIHWPGALADFSAHPRRMAILQHELQHALEFATGALTPLGYAFNPHNWIYRYRLEPGRRWERYGAEQRASMAEDLWRRQWAGQGSAELEALIPWARNAKRPGDGVPGALQTEV